MCRGYTIFCLLLSIVSIEGVARDSANTESQSILGTARNERGEVAYLEYHYLQMQGGRPVRIETNYVGLDGSQFARLTASFRHHPYVPDFKFFDHRFGREAGTTVKGRRVKLFGRERWGAKETEEWVPLSGATVTGQGLHLFIWDHADELLKRGVMKNVRILLPIEGRSYTFIMRPQPPSRDPGTLTVKFQIDSWFPGFFAPDFQLRYDIGAEQLLSYSGPSNILDDAANVQRVTITYDYDVRGDGFARMRSSP